MATTYKKYLLSKGFSSSTSESYYRSLLQYSIWATSHQIETEQSSYNEIIGYVQYLKNKETCGERGRTIKRRTIQLHLNGLKHYFNWLIKRQIRSDNPTLNIDIKGVKRKTLHHILNNQELEKLYFDYKSSPSACAEQGRSKSLAKRRNEVIVSLLIYQGLNTSELKKLQVRDLKLREGKIQIQGSRKSNPRTLQLEAHQILDFMEYTLQIRQEILKETNKQTDLFLVSTGSSLDLQNTLQKLVAQLQKQNHKIANLQQIRASVITSWLKRYNLREAQYMAGHRYVSSTESYLINDLEDLQEDINTYHPLN